MDPEIGKIRQVGERSNRFIDQCVETNLDKGIIKPGK